MKFGVLWIFSLNLIMASATAAPLVFEFVGDWGEILLPGQELVAEAMGQWAATHQPQFIVSGGDNFYPWGAYSPDDWQFDSKWRDIYTHPGIANLTWYMSLGNHDYGDVDNEWNQVHFGNTEPRWYLPHVWYDFRAEVGDKLVHFLVFDTEAWRKGYNKTEQEEWFKRTLATSDGHWIIVVGHRPVFSAGNYGPISGSLYNYFTPLFEQYNVDLYICGHDHNLQHIQKIDGGVTNTDYVIGGAGGALWYGYDEEAEQRLRDEFGMTVSFFEMTWGFNGVTISEDEIHVEFIDSEGTKLYEYTRPHRSSMT